MVGSVIKDHYGNLWIISKHYSGTDKLKPGVHCISFSSSNCSGFIPYETHTKTDSCSCMGEDSECEDCNGTTFVETTRYGLEDCKLLASSVKSYILKRLTKNFDF